MKFYKFYAEFKDTNTFMIYLIAGSLNHVLVHSGNMFIIFLYYFLWKKDIMFVKFKKVEKIEVS
jgi:hypothetical protein